MKTKAERNPGTERFTLLEAKGPTHPTPAQLALPVATGEPAGVMAALSAWIAEERAAGGLPPGEPAEVIARRTLDPLRQELSRAAG